MPYSRGISALAVLSLLPMLTAGEPSFTPQAGLLLLRNGHVLAGRITQAGDYYIVLLDEKSELRLPAKDVEAQVATLEEAYELKRHGLFGRGAGPHLDLADWCLRQGLHGCCEEQLAEATRVEADNPRIAEIQRRLKLATTEPPAIAPAPAAPVSTTVSAEEIEKAVRALPKGSLEKFSAVIQPLLVNRCGASACHGPNSHSELRLVRPPPGQAPTQRITHRNLYAVLQQLDPSEPAKSPLLIEGQRRHGTALTAVFDKHMQKQFEELKAWVLMTVAAPQAAAPATIGPARETTLSQPAPQPAAAASDSQGAPPAGTRATDRFVPRDPFDPELFNRRFHSKEQ